MIFSIDPAPRGATFDFKVCVIGDFDDLPQWWRQAFEAEWSWWDGDETSVSWERFCERVSPEQRASVKRLLRRASRRRDRCPRFDVAALARCERAFAKGAYEI